MPPSQPRKRWQQRLRRPPRVRAAKGRRRSFGFRTPVLEQSKGSWGSWARSAAAEAAAAARGRTWGWRGSTVQRRRREPGRPFTSTRAACGEAPAGAETDSSVFHCFPLVLSHPVFDVSLKPPAWQSPGQSSLDVRSQQNRSVLQSAQPASPHQQTTTRLEPTASQCVCHAHRASSWRACSTDDAGNAFAGACMQADAVTD